MSQFVVFANYLLQQPQVLTPSAIDSIAKSGSSLTIQLPILGVALLGLILAFMRFKHNRIISILTIIASGLLFLSSLVSPLVSVWLPFFYTPPSQTLPDGTVVPPSLEILQNNLFFADLINSLIVSIALLIYLAAIFSGRNSAIPKTVAKPSIEPL